MKIKFKNIKPGDVFCFYVGDGTYAFSRLLYFIKKSFYIAEIFDYQSKTPDFDKRILYSKRLTPLLPINFLVNMDREYWNWEVIYRDSDFSIPLDEIRVLEFSVGLGQAIRYNVDWTPDSGEMRLLTRDISPEEVNKLESSDIQMNTHWLYMRIRELWDLKPYEWKSTQEMWKWFYDNKVYFTNHSNNS